jgi:predicted O-methyltransferase YrrM
MVCNRLGFALEHTHLQPQEATLLYALVHATKPRHVFEVGSFQGGSAHIIAEALIDAGEPPTLESFFMIDPQPRLAALHAAFLEDKATIIAALSPAAYRMLPRVTPGFEFAFIDGDHAEAAVHADLVGALPLLAPGALVLCHDAAYAPTRRGIDRAVREGGFIDCGELVASPVWTEQFEAGERVLWGGLRLLRRSADTRHT